MSGAVGTGSTSGLFGEKKYIRLILGTLIHEGVHNRTIVTEPSLTKLAVALKETFREVFGGSWSFIVLTGKSDRQGCIDGWFHWAIGGHCYTVAGAKYLSSNATSEWAAKYRDYFIKEFACQQWVPDCDPICTSLKLKYKDQFGDEPIVVVVRGGVAGSSIVGSFHSHSDHKVWIIHR
jgi:hypothetical protein